MKSGWGGTNRHGGTNEAKGRHLGGTEEAPRKLLGGTKEPMAHRAALPTKYFVLGLTNKRTEDLSRRWANGPAKLVGRAD